MQTPEFEDIPLGEYDWVPDAEEGEEVSAEDLGFHTVEFERGVPMPFEYKPRDKAPRSAVAARNNQALRPFLDLPKSLQNTVVGRLAGIIATKLEFPEVSTFLSLLASASSAVACAYATQYRSKTAVALGLYAVIEQPPATQKSYLLGIGGDAYAMAIGEHNKRISAKNRENIERDLDRENNMQYGFALTTDATSAALDRGLAHCSEGRFVVASAEQSALMSLFPDAGTYSSNNELILKGYAGEYVNGMRGGREAFVGVVQGSIVLIAQPGSCRRVLSASNGTGMAERFFFLSEPTMLGIREHTGAYPSSSETRAFEEACKRCVELYSDRIMSQSAIRFSDREKMDPKYLNKVRPSDHGYSLILGQRRDMEGHLGELAEAGEMVALSWLGKYETHVLKVAGVLHVIECLGNGVHPPEVIPDDMVCAAMDFVDLLGDHLNEILHDAGESGSEAEEDCFIDVLSNKPLTRREVMLKVKNRKPYKSMGRNAYAAANRRLDAMLASGVIMVNATGRLVVV